jgi:hypothetical protein
VLDGTNWRGRDKPLAPRRTSGAGEMGRGRRFPLRLVQRAQIICKADEGLRSKDIASINIFVLTPQVCGPQGRYWISDGKYLLKILFHRRCEILLVVAKA